MKKILVMGLSGAGKTTFSKNVCKHLEVNYIPYVYINGDLLRSQTNNYDFSRDGRIQQARCIQELCNINNTIYLIDIIAPLEKCREIIKPDYIIYLNTIQSCVFKNTNDMFELPKQFNIMVDNFNKINVISDYVGLCLLNNSLFQ